MLCIQEPIKNEQQICKKKRKKEKVITFLFKIDYLKIVFTFAFNYLFAILSGSKKIKIIQSHFSNLSKTRCP